MYLNYDKPANPINPGPGTYSPPDSVGRVGSKYTLASKASFTQSKYLVKVPGPGSYPIPSCINEEGKYFYSLYKNSGAGKFSPLAANYKLKSNFK